MPSMSDAPGGPKVSCHLQFCLQLLDHPPAVMCSDVANGLVDEVW